ncbi:DUF6351 family protein [Kutzneria albida]|uniref:DUF6351 family protein n=1 Tax=Kutzneria albida TaxID=43357 RepID=UPI0004A9FC5B|nr:DUF6351 family protein [Kutzneria albida]
MIRRGLTVAATLVFLGSTVAAATDGTDESALTQPGPPVEVLSSRPEFVTGGDALVRVRVPEGARPEQVRVAVNGLDQTRAFHTEPDGRALTGLVTGLHLGENNLVGALPGTRPVHLTLYDRSTDGPLFAGPKEQPFACETTGFRTAGGQLLGRATGPSCTVPTRVEHLTRKRVPHRIRVETGVLDRGIYEIAMPEGAWNHRLVYTFGGGCPGGWYTQGRATAGVLDEVMLRRGYAIASSTLNVFGTNCDDLLASEVMAMVKERFVEEFGPPLFTIGWGCSGGSYQAHQIADNYPGLLDGIAVACSFPDLVSGSTQVLTDAALLDHYFAKSTLDSAQRRAVSGFGVTATSPLLANQARRIDPRAFCPATLHTAARCDIYDHAVNVYGRDPRTGAARRPLDNTGVQYGLAALNSRKISFAQFLDLNARIGGFDAEGGFSPARSVADRDSVSLAYRTGRVLSGGGGLGSIPVVDYRSYTDDLPGGDMHLSLHTAATRARLVAANGDADNQVLLAENGSHGGFLTANPVVADLLAQLDAWLTAIARDPTGPAHQRVVRNRPTGLADACWTPDAAHQKVLDPGRCAALYPVWPGPRRVAGGPVAGDVLKCALHPVTAADYRVPVDLAALAGVFPDGVCDWSRPGVGQQPLSGTWLSFGGQ